MVDENSPNKSGSVHGVKTKKVAFLQATLQNIFIKK
jgi:hypothetical protein